MTPNLIVGRRVKDNLSKIMTVKEFVGAIQKNPGLLNEDIHIVTETQQVTEGKWDGGVQITSKPLKSVTFAFSGVLLFLDPTVQPKIDIQIKNPPEQIAGPVPDALKHLLKINLKGGSTSD